MAEAQKNLYPEFSVENNKKPNRLLNFPFLAAIIKIILLIPVWIEACFLGIAAIFFLIANWFFISFTGKYWDSAYKFFLGFMRFWGKIELYFFGITDKYPGFGLNTNGLFELNIPKPEKPNRWFAIPLLGIFARFILLIPYLLFTDVLQRGARLALLLSWFAILFKGKLPESFYEFERDSLRVSFAANAYMIGLSDSYPNFHISMNHQTTKILLIIVGAMLTTFNFLGSLGSTASSVAEKQPTYQHKYYDDDDRYDYAPPSDVDVRYNTY